MSKWQSECKRVCSWVEERMCEWACDWVGEWLIVSEGWNLWQLLAEKQLRSRCLSYWVCDWVGESVSVWMSVNMSERVIEFVSVRVSVSVSVLDVWMWVCAGVFELIRVWECVLGYWVCDRVGESVSVWMSVNMSERVIEFVSVGVSVSVSVLGVWMWVCAGVFELIRVWECVLS